MRMVKTASLLIILTCLTVVLWSRPTPSQAAAAISVTPASQQLELLPDQTNLALSVDLTNSTASEVTLDLQVVDFDSDQQLAGRAVFAGLDATEFTTVHGVAKWLSLEQSSLTLQPGQTATVTGNLRNSDDLSPGGHYGAILATQKSSDSSNQVGVQPAVSSLLFIAKRGGEVLGVSLNVVQSERSWWGGVTDTGLQFDNPGNVHVVPRGLVEVIDPWQRVIGKGVINAESAILLPGQDRTLQVPVQSQGLPLWPGTYILSSQYRYDGSDELQVKEQAYFSLGLVLPTTLGLMACGLIGWQVYRRCHY